MTDKEIIKALECCGSDKYGFACEECPRLHNGIENERYCRRDLIISAYDLIKRQQAEIERLEKGELRKAMTFNSDTIKRCVDEALKNFAEEFEKRCIESGIYPALIKNILKNLVKELTEGSNEKET